MGWEKQFVKKPSDAPSKAHALEAFLQDASGDITSEKCIPKNLRCTGRIVAKSSFVLCGIVEAGAIFRSRKLRVKWNFREGQRVPSGSAIATVSGNARAVLACERTALNYLMLLSGIATKSAAAAEKYGKWKIAATRKTIPLLSSSQKRAALLGGCLTHRMSLSDGILIKDNHIAAIMNLRGCKSEEAARIAVSSFPRGSFVEVEVSTVPEALAAVNAGAAAILVDNVGPSGLKKIASAARKANRKIIIEASGGITLENAGAYLAAGADFVSTSEITMKTDPADLSLEIEK